MHKLVNTCKRPTTGYCHPEGRDWKRNSSDVYVSVITLLFIIYVYFYAFPWQPNMSASIYLHVSLRGGIHGDVITTSLPPFFFYRQYSQNII